MVLEDPETSDALWWRAFCALGSLRAEEVLAYGRAELQERRRGNPMAETVVYRALGELDNDEARAFLMERLEIENDPATVAEVLSALGRHQNSGVQDLLVRLVDPANWPTSWPPPGPPRRQGDQRPDDRRSFAIIAGLEQFADARSAAVLSRLAEDREQPYHLREIAGSAARNIELAGGLETGA
jgi:HEAT repeat protein